MTFMITNHSLRRLTLVLSAGILALGLSGGASARGAGFGHGANTDRAYDSVTVVHHRYRGHPRRHYRYKRHGNKHRGHGRRHYRNRYRGHGRRHHPRRVVYVRNYYPPPVEVVHVYEQPTPVVQRFVTPRTYEPAPVAVDSRINAGSLMGAALGGLIGSQIGNGRGQLAATAAGTVGGFLLGDHVTNVYR